jgi:hypothetical protein
MSMFSRVRRRLKRNFDAVLVTGDVVGLLVAVFAVALLVEAVGSLL